MTTKLAIPVLVFAILFGTARDVFMQADGQIPSVLRPHCIGAGPLAISLEDNDIEDFCGCTWGTVYYRGEPVIGARVILAFEGQQFYADTKTNPHFPAPPYYVTSGDSFGNTPKRGDIMSVSTTFAGETRQQDFRALPPVEGENKHEQEVPLVLQERGEWKPLLTGGYTRTLTIQSATIWAGGPAGLTAINPATTESTPQQLPWSDQSVIVTTAGIDDELWVAGVGKLAHYDGAQWHNISLPFSRTVTVRALTVEQQNGALWVGGYDNALRSALAVYDNGSWTEITAIPALITTLTVDPQGGIWAGTYAASQGGVYYLPSDAPDRNSDWQPHDTVTGLASDLVLTAATHGDDLWFGTTPYAGSGGHTRGGISRYDLGTAHWETHGITNNLPADSGISGAPTAITALAVDPATGTPWAGTANGVHLPARHSANMAYTFWVTDTVTSSTVRAIAIQGDLVVAAEQNGQIRYLDRSITPGNPPTAQFTATTAAIATIPLTDTLQLAATAQDQDEANAGTANQILAWDWRSDLDGPLCTTANTCAIETRYLQAGEHTITLRVQDNEGVWSAPVTTRVMITPTTPPVTVTVTVTPSATFTPTPAITQTSTPTPTSTPNPIGTATKSSIFLPIINQ